MGLGLPLGQACLLPSGCWALWETLVKWEQAGWPGAENLGDQQPGRVLQRMRAGEVSMSAVAWPQRPAVWVQIQLRGPWKPQRGVMGWNCIQETLALCSEPWPGPAGGRRAWRQLLRGTPLPRDLV